MRFENLNDRSRGADADVHFAKGIVVDRVELHILIAAAFSGGGIGLAKEIELGALLRKFLLSDGKHLPRRGGLGWWCGRA